MRDGLGDSVVGVYSETIAVGRRRHLMCVSGFLLETTTGSVDGGGKKGKTDSGSVTTDRCDGVPVRYMNQQRTIDDASAAYVSEL